MKEYRDSGYKAALYIPLHDHQVKPDCIASSHGEVYKMGYQKGLEYMGESRVDFMKEDAQEAARLPPPERNQPDNEKGVFCR